jgi:hypothetical protein
MGLDQVQVPAYLPAREPALAPGQAREMRRVRALP